MPKEPKTFAQIITKNLADDPGIRIIGKIRMSGTDMWVGVSGDCLFYTDDEIPREPTYFSVPEAKLLIQLLKVSIAELKGDN